jgi:AcrR family transcriptional regulator
MGKKKSGESFYQLHHQAMEAKILRISKRLLLKRGFAMLGMDEIASKVGLSRQRLYCYFRGIDPIIYEIQIADMNEFITAMKEAYLALSTLPPEQRIQSMIDAAFAYQNTRREDFLFTSDFDTYYRAEKKGLDAYRARYEKAYNDFDFNAMLHRLFVEGQQSGTFRKDLSPEAATIFWSNTLQLLLERLSIFESNPEQNNPAIAEIIKREMRSALGKYLH